MNISRRENRAAQQCNMSFSQCSIFRNCLLTGPIPVFIGRPIKFSYELQTKPKNKYTNRKNKIKINKIKTEQLASWYKPCFRTIPEYSPTCCTALMRNPVPSTLSVEKTLNHLENTPRQRQNTGQHRTKDKRKTKTHTELFGKSFSKPWLIVSLIRMLILPNSSIEASAPVLLSAAGQKCLWLDFILGAAQHQESSHVSEKFSQN